MSSAHGAEHLDDGTALRLLDAELAYSARAACHAHTRQCRACAERVDSLDRASRRVCAAIRLLGPDTTRAARDRGGSRWSWRSAGRAASPVPLAIVASALIVAAAAVPVTLSVPRRSRAVATNAAERGPATGLLATVIEFEPTGTVLTVELEPRGVAGQLELSAHPDSFVAVHAVENAIGPPAHDIVVLPRVLRLAPTGVTRPHYRVLVPETLTSVVVRVGSATVLMTNGRALLARSQVVHFP